MRPVSEYTPAEWLKGMPFEHGFKRARNVLIDRAYRACRPRRYDDFVAELAGSGNKTLAFMIAFDTPWVIDLSTRMAKRNLKAPLIVCDNSRKRRARREIERICRDRGVPYLRLPFNPEWHHCRSHGLALNWIYSNLALPVQPEIVGFLDHDLLVIEPLDIAELTARQPFYGLRRGSRWGWYLWPGLCVFRVAAMAKYALDFNTDIPRVLDTGGRNWTAVFRHFDPGALQFASSSVAWLSDGVASAPVAVQIVDKQIHVGAASRGARGLGAAAPTFFGRIVRHLEQGGTLAELQASPPLSATA